MYRLLGKKIIAFLHSKILLNWTYGIMHILFNTCVIEVLKKGNIKTSAYRSIFNQEIHFNKFFDRFF